MAKHSLLEWAFQIRTEADQRARSALRQVGIQILKDSILDVPRCPVKTGSLACSGSVHLDGMCIATSASWRSQVEVVEHSNFDPTPNRDMMTLLAGQRHRVVIGFNKPYARRLHFSPELHFRPFQGAMWLTLKLVQNQEKYRGMIRKYIRIRRDVL